MRVIELAGSHYEMGKQHAYQVRDLRPRIVDAMHLRLKTLESYQVDMEPYVSELASAWEEVAQPTLEMLRGIAEGLELDWALFFRYTVAPYLADRVQRPAYGEGCTVWAASGSITRQGMPILAKNRDYRPEHQSLPCLACVQPARGYRFAICTRLALAVRPYSALA